MKKRISIVIGMLLCFGLVSCGKKVAQKTLVILFDLSESTNKDRARGNYLNGLKVILSKVNHGDVIVGDRILESSVAQSILPINESVPPFTSSTDNPFFVKKEKTKADEELNKTKEKIYKTAESLLLRKDLKRKVMKTDILSSLFIAEQVFKTYKNEKNILVIFSDMIEESGDYNFAKETLSEKRIQEIISKEKGKKRIPDLAGVKVYITGATATTSDKFFAVQNFWFIYFKECGATLAKENYGSALLSFKE